MAERAQCAGGAGGGGEGRGHGGLVEQVLDLGAEAGGAVAEELYQEEVGAGQARGRNRVERVAVADRRAGRFGAAGVRAGEAAGGEVGKEAGEVLADAGDAAPERQGADAENAEAGGDEEEDGVQDDVGLAGEVGGRIGADGLLASGVRASAAGGMLPMLFMVCF